MEYSKLVSVTGLPGLYELVHTKSDGAIIRSIEDQTTRFISSRIHNFLQLEGIEVFTHNDNINLVEVFHAMEKSNEPLPDEKDAVAVKNYFQRIFPDMDFEKVYDSDRKKMLRWFTFLKKHNIEIKLPEPVMEPEPLPSETKTEPLEEEKPGEEKISKNPSKDTKKSPEKKSSKAASSKKSAEKKESKPEKKSAAKKKDKKSDNKKKK